MSNSPQTVRDNSQPQSDRLDIHYLGDRQQVAKTDDGRDVIQGLTQTPKTLPPRYFYDDRGSQLFEQICELPEYYPTRTEAWILQQYAPEIAQKTGACELLELGSGSSTKTRLLLDAYQEQTYPLYYSPIDVSAGILEASAKALLERYPTLKIRGQVGTYAQAIAQFPPPLLPRRLVFFLGSTLGNFTPQECDRFFSQISTVLSPGDYFLLGIDLQKPQDILTAAYNDAQGVTAAFNLNAIAHLNWRFGSNFDLSLFQHQAIYNATEAQIEMYLRCSKDCTVNFEKLNLSVDFVAGESIRTEISRKFNLEQMQQYLQSLGLQSIQAWRDPKQWFAVLLCQVK